MSPMVERTRAAQTTLLLLPSLTEMELQVELSPSSASVHMRKLSQKLTTYRTVSAHRVRSSSVERVNKIAEPNEAGSVWSNTRFELNPRVPFGGHKESGTGTEWGVGGLKSYCNWQTLSLKKSGAPMSDPPLVG